MSNFERSFSQPPKVDRARLPKRERVPLYSQQRDKLISPVSQDAFRADSQRFRDELDRLSTVLDDEQAYFDTLKTEELEDQNRVLGADYDVQIEREMREEERRARDAKIPRLPENWRDIREQRAIDKAAREIQARIDAEMATNPDDFDNGEDRIELSLPRKDEPEIEELDNSLLEDIAPERTPEERLQLKRENNPLRNFRGFPKPITPASMTPRAEAAPTISEEERARLHRENRPDIKIPHIPKAIEPAPVTPKMEVAPIVSEEERSRNEFAAKLAQKQIELAALEQEITRKQQDFERKFGVDPIAHNLKAHSWVKRKWHGGRMFLKDIAHSMSGAAEPTSDDALAELQALDLKSRTLFDEISEEKKRLEILDAEKTNTVFSKISPEGIGKEYAAAWRGQLIANRRLPADDETLFGEDTWKEREKAYRRLGGVINRDEPLWQDASPEMAAAGAAFMDTGDDQTKLAESRIAREVETQASAELWDDLSGKRRKKKPQAVPVAKAEIPVKTAEPYSIPETRDENLETDDRPTPQDDAVAKAIYSDAIIQRPGRSEAYNKKDGYLNKVAMKELNDAMERDPILMKMQSGSKVERLARERIIDGVKKEFSRHLEREIKLAYNQEIGGEENSTPEQVQMRVRDQISELLNGVHAWTAVEARAEDSRAATTASLRALENIIRPAKGGSKYRALKILEQELEKPFTKAESRYVTGFSQDGADILKRAERWQDTLEEIVGLTQHAIDTLEAHRSSENTGVAESILGQLLNNLRDTLVQRRDPQEIIQLLKSELRFQSNVLKLPLIEEAGRRVA